MNAYQRRWLLLLVVGLFAASGASCPRMIRQVTNPLPRVLPPAAPLEKVIEVVNRNNSQIQSFSTNRASISGQGFPSLTASIAFQRPQRFRMKAEWMTGAEFDMGSNDEFFWFWMRRQEPPAVYKCRHDQFAASQARQAVPFDPKWLIEAFGVAEFDPGLPHQISYLPNDRIRIDTIRNTPQGPMTKIAILDGSQGWILEQHLFDAQRHPVGSSVASGHRRDPLSGLVMPTVVQINCPASQLAMRIDLGNVEINRLTDDRAALWTVPSIPGTPVVDMGDPNFRPPAAQTTATHSRRTTR